MGYLQHLESEALQNTNFKKHFKTSTVQQSIVEAFVMLECGSLTRYMGTVWSRSSPFFLPVSPRHRAIRIPCLREQKKKAAAAAAVTAIPISGPRVNDGGNGQSGRLPLQLGNASTSAVV